MKSKLLLILLILISMLIACSTDTTVEQQVNPFDSSGLLAQKNNTFAVHTIGSTVIHPNDLTKAKIKKVIDSVSNQSSLENFKEQHPSIEITQEPAFLVFDTNKLVHTSYSYEDLLAFLQK
ncbi:hypothetical protein JOC85_001864 [Bacillus mesophilus]|uniref:Uncharacterized protein n=1 Tax=Bacillus mesophilus TaxID=1808955 RepID=A0A6M0Q4R3_9BACI|nr:hypothetical protein [Bacillus mesophilus]MBM7661092.1 hypothetical protein [Bacillus mesophilus]NEY71375.1 hypothetical protein [Bacillus mesophilus]